MQHHRFMVEMNVMALHHQLGKHGEELACGYLKEVCFTILYRNWRHSYYEIDIIGARDNVLHFIEIKTRKSLRYGYPEDDVDEKKLEKLMIAAEEFLYQHPQWERVQYDVLSIH